MYGCPTQSIVLLSDLFLFQQVLSTQVTATFWSTHTVCDHLHHECIGVRKD